MVVVGLLYGQAYCYGQRTPVHFIDGILNAQRYRDEILRPVVVSSTTITSCCSMIMHSPHVSTICTQFLEVENIPVLVWPVYSPDMSPIEHVWDALDRCIYDSVFQFLPISSNFAQPLKRSGTTFHRPQSTLCEGDVLHCVRQMLVTPDTDWFSNPLDPPLL